ncbi:hypothetical protein [Halomonas stenophila]|uniref:Uncharacterized protein n=1 Tax=Halomonas stenophila TaxID=795312 RepID=A0A7W5HLY9_9GAMM|nr:hypothetical protein [Halomonas stenophila]MBB3231729.1 hypothetical protein [Halomonas stenophila]
MGREQHKGADLKANYQRLRADVQAARDKIGDTPMPSAGSTAVALLEQVLQRHPIHPMEDQPS